MQLWIATSNQGKLNEFKSLLNGKGIEVHSSSELSVFSHPKETGVTFLENARIKVRYLKAVKPQCWVVADDSGLEVEGLGGLPGIHSARYAGEHASDQENMAKLLKMMQLRSPQNRKALMRCVLVVLPPSGGQEEVIEGVIQGTIAEKLRGQYGFGYDPVFIPQGETKTFAELGVAYKNQFSHRAQTIKKLSQLITK
ncbi:MAG: RdgB/HAM1 family non-canonical purine NTP pyrophosphatase [Bdellovibrionales bacterium]|nr:RdgB/HAM1 family non-canonical purine NTP pyrophosphatase [Bdellovibrionales bacterium]